MCHFCSINLIEKVELFEACLPGLVTQPAAAATGEVMEQKLEEPLFSGPAPPEHVNVVPDEEALCDIT